MKIQSSKSILKLSHTIMWHSCFSYYTSFQRPNTVVENGVTATFAYNGDGERVRMNVTQGATTLLTRHYIGRQYEQDVQSNIERLYLGGDAYSAPAVLIRHGTSAWSSIHYICRDHLGSVTQVTHANGATLMQERSFDAWGRLRNPNNHALFAPGSEPALLLGRGFTGHEHLPWFGLINMNARLYDPAIGRFLSPDPFVLNPLFSQDYNRYTYCLNNPLKYVDKNGEFWHIIIGAIVGGTINLISNWNNIDNVWQGLASFGVGAGQGALVAVNPALGAIVGSGAASASNELIRQSGRYDSINWGRVGSQAGIGAAAGATTFGAGRVLQNTGAINRVLLT